MTGPLKNPKHETFCQLRAQGATQEAAYVEAGFKPNRQNAYKLSTKDYIVRRIAELTAPALKKTMLTIEQLYQTFLDQGTYDPSVFADVKTPEDLRDKVDEATRRLLVKGWKFDRTGRVILDLVDKEKAMERIARHQSFFNDTLKVDMGSFGNLLERAEKGVLDADT